MAKKSKKTKAKKTKKAKKKVVSQAQEEGRAASRSQEENGEEEIRQEDARSRKPKAKAKKKAAPKKAAAPKPAPMMAPKPAAEPPAWRRKPAMPPGRAAEVRRQNSQAAPRKRRTAVNAQTVKPRFEVARRRARRRLQAAAAATKTTRGLVRKNRPRAGAKPRQQREQNPPPQKAKPRPNKLAKRTSVKPDQRTRVAKAATPHRRRARVAARPRGVEACRRRPRVKASPSTAASGPRYDEILTRAGARFLADLHRKFDARARAAAGRARRAAEALRRRRTAGFPAARRESDPRRRDWTRRADPGRSAGPARRDHRAGRPQDGHQCAQFGRQRLHGGFRGRQFADLGEQHRRPDQPEGPLGRQDRLHRSGQRGKPYKLGENRRC